MYSVSVLSLVLLATSAAAQMSLSQALSQNNGTLSTLSMLLMQQPALLRSLSNMTTGMTILAPSNAAFSKFLASPENKAAVGKSDVVTAVLSYHVLNGTFPASKFTTQAQFIPTLLTNESYTGVTGGQVVQVALDGSKAVVTTGLKETSFTKQTDIMFNGGVMHIIDTVLTIPISPSMTAIDSKLTSLAGGLTNTNLVTAVDGLKDATIFAPSNEAFEKIGNTAAALPSDQLGQILQYHVLKGTVGYSPLLTSGLANESFPTLTGAPLTVTAEDAKVFVNSAQVITTDIIVSNGIMHVIDNVLNPANSTIVTNPTATTQPIAFEGATSAAVAPFTSGIKATTTAPSAATGTSAVRNEAREKGRSMGMGGALVVVAGAAAVWL